MEKRSQNIKPKAMTANEKDFPTPQYPSKENGYNSGLGSPSDKLRDAGFNNGGQVPAYGNELTALQLIDKLQSENESLMDALKELVKLKDIKDKYGNKFGWFASIQKQEYDVRKSLALEQARKLVKDK